MPLKNFQIFNNIYLGLFLYCNNLGNWWTYQISNLQQSKSCPGRAGRTSSHFVNFGSTTCNLCTVSVFDYRSQVNVCVSHPHLRYYFPSVGLSRSPPRQHLRKAGKGRISWLVPISLSVRFGKTSVLNYATRAVDNCDALPQTDRRVPCPGPRHERGVFSSFEHSVTH